MNKIIFWTMAAFAFLFASCAGEEEVTTPANPLKNKPINVDVLVSDIKTRAGYDTDNLPTQFYLTIDQGGEDYDYTNVVMKYEDGKWVAYASDAADAAKVDMHWAGSEGNITVKAATFSLAAASASLNALTGQSTAEAIKSSDHLYYYSNAVTPSSDGTISIPLDHVMSKLEVKVTLRNQYGGSGSNPITSAIVFGSATSATYTIAEATQWSNPSAALDITSCLSAYNSTNRIATYEAILIPQNIAANTFGVKVTIGGKSYTWKSANAITLQGGKKYTLDLTLGKNELTLNTLSVGDWKEETVTGLNAEQIPYVTFTAEKSQTCRFFISNAFATALGENEYFEYSVGDGEWKRFKATVENIDFGGTLGSLRLRGKSSKGTASSSSKYSKIEFTTENSLVDCTGDIRTLIDYENYADVSTDDAKFCLLFYLNKQLRTAPSLPATTLTSYCYREMFVGCSALIEAPALPATTLANNCYIQMFSGCSSLTQAPALPATTLANYCYQDMFSGCTQLTQAPEL
ncbi:MAG: fimbrillin family protein, partial [Prevotella sp.]